MEYNASHDFRGSRERSLVPSGDGFGKLRPFGKRPVNPTAVF